MVLYILGILVIDLGQYGVGLHQTDRQIQTGQRKRLQLLNVVTCNKLGIVTKLMKAA